MTPHLKQASESHSLLGNEAGRISLERTAELIAELFQLEAVFAMVEGPEGRIHVAFGEADPDWIPTPFMEATADHKTLAIQDLGAASTPTARDWSSQGIRSVVQVPLWSSQGQRLGFLWAGSDRPRSWKTQSLSVLETLASAVVNEVELRLSGADQQQSIQALQQREEGLRLLVESVEEYAIFMTDPDGFVVSWNEGAARIFGLEDSEILRKPSGILHPQSGGGKARTDGELRRVAQESGQAEDEGWRIRKGGVPFWAKVVVTALKDGRGGLVGFSVMVRDLTERKEAEDALQERDAVLEAVSFAADRFLKRFDWGEMLHEVLARLGTATGASRVYVFQNHAADDESVLTSQRYEWCNADIPRRGTDPRLQNLSYHANGLRRWEVVLGRGEVVHGNAYDFPPREREFLSNIGARSLALVPVFVDGWWGFLGIEESRVERRWSVSVLDVLRTAADTIGNAIARRDAETALEESEQGLQQRGKMEAVGRLAGGIAHDFNNLLTAIKGNADLLLADFPEDDPRVEDIKEIQAGADRAAELTKGLLAFGRRQILKPQILNPGDVIQGFSNFLRRMIGADIPMDVHVDDGVWSVRADKIQLEQVVMNLVVNAKDALPEKGGRLEVRCENTTVSRDDPRRRAVMPPGRYLVISVADNGSGMSDEVQQKIFEPFFTTKAVGAGTGLGLATVYGIVKQSDGFIWVDSAPGAGTTFRVYLPPAQDSAGDPVAEQQTPTPSSGLDENQEDGNSAASDGIPTQVTPAEPAAPAEPLRAEEPANPAPSPDLTPEPDEDPVATVLLAEDESVVRRLATRVLERQGYRVLQGENGAKALAIFEEHGDRIDLLVTDMVMPEMGGRELAEAIAKAQPDVRVLYMSGYTADEVFRQALPTARNRFLQKPFAPDELAEKAREILEGPCYRQGE